MGYGHGSQKFSNQSLAQLWQFASHEEHEPDSFLGWIRTWAVLNIGWLLLICSRIWSELTLGRDMGLASYLSLFWVDMTHSIWMNDIHTVTPLEGRSPSLLSLMHICCGNMVLVPQRQLIQLESMSKKNSQLQTRYRHRQRGFQRPSSILGTQKLPSHCHWHRTAKSKPAHDKTAQYSSWFETSDGLWNPYEHAPMEGNRSLRFRVRRHFYSNQMDY